MVGRREAGGMWTCLRHPASHRLRCRTLGALVAVAGLLLATRATAEAGLRIAVEWEKLGALLRRDDISPRLPWSPDADRTLATLRPAPASNVGWAQDPGRWSLVARDWEAARLLLGRLAPTDEVKRGRSKRMVLLRGRFADGPVAPFVQVGLGQWRIDPDMPLMPHDSVSAGQLGAGVELALTSWMSVALEADCTVLDPGRLENNPQVMPHARLEPDLQSRDARWVHPSVLLGSFVAARARF